MKIAFVTLGCKVNQYESQALGELFEARGHSLVSPEDLPDAVIINSCTVTAESDRKSRKSLSHYRRKYPGAVLALIGCYPQAFPENVKRLEGVDVVLGTRDKSRVVAAVEDAALTHNRLLDVTEHRDAQMEPMQITGFEGRTRAFLKIQDGCDRFCSYCIIPYARGRICSKPLKDAVAEAQALARAGFSELVLVGIDLSAFGRGQGLCLTDAVEAVAAVPGIRRVRLGSLEPEVLSEKDIERLTQIENFCPQFHLSLQSGCDTTLHRMNRHYDTQMYREIAKKLRDAFPGATLTTDVMVGFAGETAEEFESSLNFVREMRFLKVHVFPYSERSGTRAASFPDPVPKSERHARCRRMIEETEKIRRDILNAQIGHTLQVLIEGKEKNGNSSGFSREYIPVQLPGEHLTEGQLLEVQVTGVCGDSCVAQMITSRK